MAGGCLKSTMIVKKNLNLIKAIPYVKVELALALVTSLLVYLIFDVADVNKFFIPNVLPSILGTALAIFLGFRCNAAYGRWGEASLTWAAIANYSRIFARLIITFVESHSHTATYDKEQARLFQEEMIHRHLAWVNALRLKLRDEKDIRVLQTFLVDADWQAIQTKQNKPVALLSMQGHRIYDAMRSGTLQGFDSFQLEGCMAQFSAYQAQCERIKNTPIPRQYTFFTRLFVWFFIVVIPFSFIQTFASAGMPWLIIPINVLLAFCYGIVERTGAVNEEPFENLITDVPITARCIDIQRDLCEMLGEPLPDTLKPENGFLF
jgi:putative membrane protein